MNLIPEWQDKNLRCHFCGETRSVKYTMKVSDPNTEGKGVEVPVCNKCILMHNRHTTKEPINKSNI